MTMEKSMALFFKEVIRYGIDENVWRRMEAVSRDVFVNILLILYV